MNPLPVFIHRELDEKLQFRMCGYNIQLFILFRIIQLLRCQLVTNHKSYESMTDVIKSCEKNGGSRLVEHFFNLIFTEFQNTPPSCTCVQMRPGRPVYCYPNGCLKKINKDSDDTHLQDYHTISTRTQTQNEDNSKPVLPFIIAAGEDFSNNLMDSSQKTKLQTKYNEKAEHAVRSEIRPNIFKDRYNTLIKYKRIPKVELKYNLREQVKTQQSRKLKIDTAIKSNKRWPNYEINNQSQFPDETKNAGKIDAWTEFNPTLIKKALIIKKENLNVHLNKEINELSKNNSLEQQPYYIENIGFETN